ncbi:unnamed protein product [Urochloa humidicola]
MHDLVHDLAISLIGDKILDQSRQANARGSKYNYALLGDCSQPLESFVTSPAHLSALRFLDCQDTELHGASFEPAESLRVLDLSECSIHKLPISIGVLKHLRYLKAPRIRDQMVPECITKLSNLTYLSLRGSSWIQALPESIGEIQGLVHLDLSGCFGIGQLPQSFGKLTSLEHLDFSYCNNVTGLSQCLATLTKLQHLNISKCKKVGTLPGALGRLTELQYLNLSDSSYCWRNGQAYVVFSLKKLKYLNLSFSDGRRTIGFHQALGGLTELEYLNLSHLTLNEGIPALFGNLCNLVHLDLSNCCNLLGVPAALDGLTKLQYLDLYSCFDGFNGMEGLQEVIGNLSELRHLNLGSCCSSKKNLGGCIEIKSSSSHPDNISSLLERICTLTNLEYLNLDGKDDIYSIPETVANLRKLRTLDLSRCGNLQRLPASISKIDSLKFINTKDCTKLDRSTLPQYTISSEMCGESSSYDLDLEYESDGWTTIRRLENVKSRKEAKAVNLREKTDIRALALQWTRDGKRYVDDDEEVLRELEPPYSVLKFRLEGYNSIRFPPWVMGISAYLRYLTSINMSDLPNCNNLPPLGQLPNLEELTIRRMDSIKKIGADLYGGTGAFPKLIRFHIVDMKCLEEWNTAHSTDENGLDEPVFPHLSQVVIRNCPRLRLKLRLPPAGLFESQVHNSDEVMLSPLETVGTAIRYQGLTRLEELIVEDCERIVPLLEWLGYLTSLIKLEILDCRGIKNLPDSIQQLTFLHTLTLRGCESIVSLPETLGNLSFLTTLTLSGCESLASLPETLGYLRLLTKLTLSGCKSIVSLPETIRGLASLMTLEVRDCKAIKTLPDSIDQLTGLNLKISGCPKLVRWCELEENKMKLARSNIKIQILEETKLGTHRPSKRCIIL